MLCCAWNSLYANEKTNFLAILSPLQIERLTIMRHKGQTGRVHFRFLCISFQRFEWHLLQMEIAQPILYLTSTASESPCSCFMSYPHCYCQCFYLNIVYIWFSFMIYLPTFSYYFIHLFTCNNLSLSFLTYLHIHSSENKPQKLKEINILIFHKHIQYIPSAYVGETKECTPSHQPSAS